ncbi:hypothetical protein [Methylobacterium planeticum]|uniref:Uncharacterized protein n=1 Tax=Methylobacterium planeticum TaxID=2615211 RepID=A0A6N6MVN7_9HYPH|nr:hypothetical protein [Methylobacterium planeticum]KAB1073859.1 hypothetical protein F6X51_08960 [Methylobacterium planeticum]
MRYAVFAAALICSTGPAFAQSQNATPSARTFEDARLNVLRAAPEPKQAKDIDTLQLASAQRVRAASVQEKTEGLWQSWTTSICEGCGDTPSYRKTIEKDFSSRKSTAGTNPGAVSVASRQQPAPREAISEQYGRRLYSDLSPETVGQIRRMPRQ